MTPGYSDLVRVFGRIGLLSFGGPAAQIALMHRELVETRPWLSEAQFLRALSFCMLLPGPEAMQLATYAGWRMRGIPGGLVAGVLFVIPGAILILLLALAYGAYGELPLVQAAFLGVKAAVIAIVVQAILRLSAKALTTVSAKLIATLAFLALVLFDLPFPVVVLLAALWGGLSWRGAVPKDPAPRIGGPALRRSLFIAVLGLLIWAAPLVLAAAAGADLVLALGLFFSKLAVVTFGGAYAVLGYMTQEVVTGQGWITAGQMVDALGLAETTPGPLILVTEFVGITAGLNAAGPGQGLGHGLGLGLLAGLMTLWVTFVPCFVWIFAGAPLIDWLDGRPRLSAALGAITAAVVGVIAHLSLWFATHVIFAQAIRFEAGPLRTTLPVWNSLSPVALGLVALSMVLLLRLKAPLPGTLAVMALVSGALGAL